jgi:hypothetical protein
LFHLPGSCLFEAVLVQELVGDPDTQPGAGGRVDRGLVPALAAGDDLVEDGFVRLEELEDEE